MASILVLESSPDLFREIQALSRGSRHVVTTVSRVRDLPCHAGVGHPALIVVNKTNGMSVIDAYNEINCLWPGSNLVVVVDSPDVSESEYVLSCGAMDYVQRGNASKRLSDIVSRLDSLVLGNDFSIEEIERNFGIVGNNQQMQSCLQLVSKASQSDASVLIHGETGTGKELIARAIHGLSRRRDNNLVVVDCASLHSSLVESILFGHAKGAFTGADSRSSGLVARANGGTLFLDEVSELPLDLQKKFLRVLQERSFLPVGDGREVNSDFRLVAATNKDLRKMVSDGLFRADLLYRIQSIKIELPPLRQRLDDLPNLTNYLIKKSCKRNKFQIKLCSDELVDTLSRHDWPGNVRELENVIDSVVAISHGQEVIYSELLPTYIRIKSAIRSIAHCESSQKKSDCVVHDADDLGDGETFPTYKLFRNQMLDTVDRRYFAELYRVSGGRVKDAMRIANLSRARLYDFYKKHGITKGG